MLRRPVFFVALGGGSSIWIGHYMGIRWMMLIMVAAASALFLYDFKERRERLTALLLALSLIAGGLVFIAEKEKLDRRQTIYEEGKVTWIEGEILSVERRTDEEGNVSDKIIIGTDSMKIVGKIPKSDRDILPGYEIRAFGTLNLLKERRNPGCFDYRLYGRSIGLSMTMSIKELEIVERDRSLRGCIYEFKRSFIDNLSEVAGNETASMMTGILFGQTGEMEDEILESFRKNGTAHILAVSGLHIGIIYGLILKIWTGVGRITRGKICGGRRWAFLVFCTCFFGIYTVLADFSPSVIRAVFMVIFHIIANLTNSRYDLCNGAMIVFLFTIFLRPYMLFNIGFQMSFMAVLMLNVVLPYIRRFYSGMLLGSIAVQIGLGPFLCYSFNYISLLAVLINIPIIFACGIIIPLGMLAILLQQTFLFAAVGDLCQIMCTCLRELNGLGNAGAFDVVSPPLWALFAYYLMVLFLLTEEGRGRLFTYRNKLSKDRNYSKKIFCYILKKVLLIVILSLFLGSISGDGFDRCNLTFVDVGQGDCVCVKVKDGPLRYRAYLFDGGGSDNYNIGKNVLRSYLLKNGIRKVEGAFVTHLHTDHCKGIWELAQEGMVENLYLYEANRLKEENIIRETGLERDNIFYLCKGDVVSLGKEGEDGVKVRVLWPEKKSEKEYARLIMDEEDENAISLVMRVDFRDKEGSQMTSVLVTGDMGKEGEDGIMRSDQKDMLRSDILKVGHHGSKTGTTDQFLQCVEPQIGVIQVGVNWYGHPSSEVLERLEERGIPVYRNDLQGAVGFQISKGKIEKIIKLIK